jgi:hypothetical protein
MQNNKIFVQIASYRDPELISTINHCLERAKNPERLTFGICWQHSLEDEWDNLNDYQNNPQFKIIDVDYKDSKGACWARNQVGTLYGGEEFTLQIDSHMRFIQDWDEVVIDVWNKIKDPKAVLTGYPPNYNPDQAESEWYNVPQICNVYTFDHKYLISRPANFPNWQEANRPYRGVYVSAGFIFSKGEIVDQIPYDPEFYFAGEETALSVRYYTHGYNLYHSHKVIVYHYYQRLENSKHWGDHEDWWKANNTAHDRLDCLLNRNNNYELGVYGLGSERTLDDYKLYSGIDFVENIIHLDTVDGAEPPVCSCPGKWNYEIINFDQEISWDPSLVEKCDDPRFWAFIIQDQNGIAIHREDIIYSEYPDIINGDVTSKKFTFTHRLPFQKPTSLLIWPYSESNNWLSFNTQLLK